MRTHVHPCLHGADSAGVECASFERIQHVLSPLRSIAQRLHLFIIQFHYDRHIGQAGRLVGRRVDGWAGAGRGGAGCP